ncbi:Spo0E family sporulation regulatory protein-aspartic acid phosphatase [Tumebacillus lipolyticus]|uniref:Spo0E family sporulation regulatory protein-aspartic acid phosphatase n=1 Tax=Tumebacillus lipolyticus TaxID=1280370 RepID=A0ABW4ZZN2_9BACL
MNCISGQIETLRQKLNETVDSYRGDFLHPNVLRVSQELDMLIVKMQHLKRKSGESESRHANL